MSPLGLSDLEIRDLLAQKDPEVTHWFFHVKCRPLFLSIAKRILGNSVDYHEFVNEIYLYLLEDHARRLRSYDGSGSLYSWIKVTAFNQILKRQEAFSQNASLQSPSESDSEPTTSLESHIAHIDVEHLISLLHRQNPRYAYVMRRFIIDDAAPEIIAEELGTSLANYYNIKSRALTHLAALAF